MNARAVRWLKHKGVKNVAADLGVSHQTVYKWARGIRTPTAENALALERLSGRKVLRSDILDDLFEGWKLDE